MHGLLFNERIVSVPFDISVSGEIFDILFVYVL